MPRKASMRAAALTALLLAALAFAGCGDDSDDGGDEGPFADVLEQVDGLTGKQREQKLVELARADGNKLNLYTSLSDRAYKQVVAAFEKRYPVKVTVFRSQDEPVAERVSQEEKAGRKGTDVLEGGGKAFPALQRQGAFVAYESPFLSTLPEEARQKGWTASRWLTLSVAWNTKNVKKGEEPKSLEELAEPKWKGRVALEASNSDWYKTVRDYWIEEQGKSEEEADRLFAAIARNAQVATSNTLMVELLAAGNYDVTAGNYLSVARRIARDGAPIAFEPVVNPIFPRPGGVALLKSADDPAAAVLFVDWILGDGQKAMSDARIDVIRKDLDHLEGERYPVDIEEYTDDARVWQDRYDTLLRDSARAK